MESYRNLSATLNASWAVYGPKDVSPDDPAELFHEASTLYPSQLARQLPGIMFLENNEQLQITATRSTKRHPHLPAIALPAGTLPNVALADVLARRRSRSEFAGKPLTLKSLALLLRAAYGVTGSARLKSGFEQSFRASPSAGALFPLDIYPIVFDAADFKAGVYHYDPLRDVLEALGTEIDREALATALPMRGLADHCAAAFVVSAMFWRSRFKYGQRGYRFALLEAGHVVQNLLLAAEALRLAAVPVGGFYDRRLAELLDVDGINEAPLYVVPLGSRA